MTPNVRSFIKKNWLLVALTAAVLVVVLWFGSRLLLDFIYFHDPNNVDVDLKPWMTPRFIVLTYDLPRPFVFELLEIPADAEGGVRLRFVAENLGLSMQELTQKVREAAAAYRAENP